MSSWKNFTGSIPPRSRCAQACGDRLHGHVVEFRQELFHVHCLLDKLTAEAPPAKVDHYQHNPFWPFQGAPP